MRTSTTMTAAATKPTVQQFEGEGFNLTTIMYKGEPCVLAKEVGRVLGYSSDGSRLSKKIGSPAWRDEFVEGEDFIKVTGQDLEFIKKFDGPEPGLTKTRRLTLLTRSGVDLVCIKTNKEIGRRLRRWLVSTIFPALRAGESVNMATHGPSANSDFELAVLREQRLAEREQRLAERERRLKAQADHKHAQQRREALLHLSNSFRSRLAVEVVQSLEVKAAEMVVGQQLDMMLPVEVESWKSPTQIGDELGCSAHFVGRMVSELNVRGVAPYSRAVLNKAATHDRTVTSYQYNEAGQQLIENLFCKKQLAA